MSDDFDAIINGEQFTAPELDTRKPGIYYYATDSQTGDSVYQVVLASRVVAHVVAVNAPTVELPAGLAKQFLPGTTGHQLVFASPDGASAIPTDGFTIKAPGGIPNRTLIKSYVMPRLADLLVRLHGIGLPLS